MTAPESQPAAPDRRPPFQFGLRALLLLFVVLGSSLAVFGGWGIVFFGLVVGLAIYVHQVESLSSLAYLVLVALCLMCLIGMLLPAVNSANSARESGRRSMCQNNLHQIASALHAYHQVSGCFPPAYIADKNGKPMHSWRVLILPYLDQDPLYKMYDFTEPWDGPNNKKLLTSRPMVYACRSDPNAFSPGATETSYVAVVGPNAAWAGEKSRKLGPVDFAAGISNTIMLLETTDAGIAWTEPRDLPLDAVGSPVVSSKHGQGKDFFFTYDGPSSFNVAMTDGSVHYLPPGSFSTDGQRKMLQIGGFGAEEQEEMASRATTYGMERRPNWPNIAALAVWLASVGTLLTHAVRSRKVVPVSPPS